MAGFVLLLIGLAIYLIAILAYNSAGIFVALFQSLAGVFAGIFDVVHDVLHKVFRLILNFIKALLRELLLTLTEVRIRLSLDKRKKLVERNLDVIGAYWSELREHDDFDKKTEACFAEIARREGWSRLIPSYRETVPPVFRPDVPVKWVGLKDYIRESLKNRITELRQKREEKERRREAEERESKLREATQRERKRREVEEREARERRIAAEREASERRRAEREERERQLEIERQERERREAIEELERLRLEEKERERTELWTASEGLIQKFLDIAERKVSILDDYGDENWDALPQEIDYCLIKIAKRRGMGERDIKTLMRKDQLPEAYSWLRTKLDEEFREYHGAQRAIPPRTSYDLNAMSGVEFEAWVGKRLTEKGYDVRGTPATGDQGADLIAKKNGKTVIVQAKRYKGAVSNKAVQEVIGAVAYYRGDEGWVVTTATSFTASAKALAQRSGVKLIDGKMLRTGTFDYGPTPDLLL
jgi:Restriction endonuclease